MRTALLLLLLASASIAEETQDTLEDRLDELERARERDRRRITELARELTRRDTAALEGEIDAYLKETQGPAVQGGSRPRWLDLSASLLVGVGGSTATNDELWVLQGGAHDPRRRGFNLQQLEVGLVGNVGPYFRAAAFIVLSLDPEEQETAIELEEAYAETLRLPGGLQARAGLFFTRFGRHNPQHPHQWQFADAPIVLARFFGPDGMRGTGFQLSWLLPTDFFLEAILSIQNTEGETMTSFRSSDEAASEQPAVEGRPFVEQTVRSLGDLVYLFRLKTSHDLGDSWTVVAGASAAFGPNYTGEDGTTQIYGIDLYLKWRPAAADRGWPFFAFQLEWLSRRFKAASFDDGMGTVLPEQTFGDHGFYAQALYGFRRPWFVGVRYEDSRGDDVAPGDAFRADRHRVSLLLGYQTSEYARLRLQVSYEKNNLMFDDDQVVSVWLVLEIGLGAHPAHTY